MNDSSVSSDFSESIYDPTQYGKLPISSHFTNEVMALCWPWLTWSGSFTNKRDKIVLDLLKRFEVIHNEHMPFAGLAGNVGEFTVVHIGHTNNEYAEPCKVPLTRESHILFPSFIIWAIKNESIRNHAVFSQHGQQVLFWHKLPLREEYVLINEHTPLHGHSIFWLIKFNALEMTP